jgi:hypothetical protein
MLNRSWETRWALLEGDIDYPPMRLFMPEPPLLYDTSAGEPTEQIRGRHGASCRSRRKRHGDGLFFASRVDAGVEQRDFIALS